MSKELSLLGQVDGQEAIRTLDKEFNGLASGAREVDRRTDAANDIALLLISKDELLVSVQPLDDGLPFHLRVNRAEAAEVYKHPYAYLGRLATSQAA